MSTNHPGAAVVNQINEIIRGETIVDGHQDRANLRHCIKGFELCMGVRRNVSDPITLSHAETLKGRRPAIASIEKLRIGQPQFTIHHSFAVAIKLARAPGKVHWG